MKQVSLNPDFILSKSQESTSKERISFLLVVLILCLLPLEGFLFPFSLKMADFALVLLVIYGFLRFANKNQHIYIPLAWPVWLILIASLIATETGLLSLDSIVAILQEVYLFIWFIVLINLLVIYLKSDFDKLIKVWSVIAILEATTALMGMMKIGPAMFYTSPIKDNILSTGEFNRGFGTFANPNATGAYLSISFFVLMATTWPRSIRFIFGIFLLAGIYGTGSMGALTSTAISFAVLVGLNIILINPRKVLLVGGILAIGTAILMMLIFVLGPFISSTINIAGIGIGNINVNDLLRLTIGRFSHSVSDRAAIIQDSWQVYYHYPLGMGPNTSVLFTETMHNDYVAFLFERGPLGLIAWLWFVIATLIVPLRKIERGKDSFHLWQILALWGGFLACVLNAFSHEISHFRQVWALMAFLYSAAYIFSVSDQFQSAIPVLNNRQTTQR